MCPPGVDQTTRGRQQWHLLSPSIEKRYDITDDCARPQHYDTHIAQFLDSGEYTWDAFDKLASRPTADDRVLESLLSKLSPASCPDCNSSLEGLPSELLTMILSEHTLGMSDVVALALCSKSLWQYCLSYIKAVASRGPWANAPLLCTGTYLTDLPPAIYEMDPSLQDEAEKWKVYLQGPGMRASYGMCPAREWNWDAISTYDDSSEAAREDIWLRTFDSVAYNERNGIAFAEKKLLRQTLGIALCVLRPSSGSTWILRNHSIQQYVQLKCVRYRAVEPRLHVKGLPKLTLDVALLMRICWTSVSEHESVLPANEKLLRGQWAGHRFDVVCVENESGRVDGSKWVDVTEGLVKEWREWKDRPYQSLSDYML